jgi:hypothetical protein
MLESAASPSPEMIDSENEDFWSGETGVITADRWFVSLLIMFSLILWPSFVTVYVYIIICYAVEVENQQCTGNSQIIAFQFITTLF